MLTVSDLGFESPSFTDKQVENYALEFFGVSGALKNLGGERDQNTRITASDGRRFVLKISGATEDPARVDFQVKALAHIGQTDSGLPVPRMIPGLDGGFVQLLEHHGRKFRVRMLTYLGGIPYCRGAFPSSQGLEMIGAFLARLDRALAGFNHPASTLFMPWDISNGRVFSEQFCSLIPAEVQAMCAPLLYRIEHEVYPQLSSVRKQVIHQDGHGGNLLRADAISEDVTGVIDFGDMIYGPLISDVAITASHFIETGDDPHDIAASLCKGFNSVTPLSGEETDLLLDLIITRHILTLQLYEFRRLNMPHSPPQDLDEKPRIIRSLQRLSVIDREVFNRNLRVACSLENTGGWT